MELEALVVKCFHKILRKDSWKVAVAIMMMFGHIKGI